MKFLLIVIILSIIASPALAAPIINDFSVQPSSSWIGEGVSASMNCTDDLNEISQAYVDIVGPNLILPTLYLSPSNGLYQLNIDSQYFDRTGIYDATFYCKNIVNENATNYSSFTFSKLTGYISGINPYPAYTSDVIEVDFMVKNGATPLSSGVVFNVSLNNQIKSIKILPAYDINKGWILKIDSPGSSGTYALNVTAFYDRTSVSNSTQLEIKNKVEFGIDSIDDTSISSSQNITVTLRAFNNGNAIDLNSNNIAIKIGSSDAVINSISKRDNVFDARITAPSLSSGSYNLEAFMNYNSQSYSDVHQIYYFVGIDGDIVDSNNKAIPTQIRFVKSGVTKLNLATDSYGHYEGSIAPDTYDIEFGFPTSTLYLSDATVDSFDDPLKYYYGDDFAIPGIRNAGLYDYEVTIPYTSAKMEVAYNDKNVINENNLRFFRCNNWNSGRKTCNSDWNEIIGQLDAVRNKVRINTSSLSAFAIGEPKRIVVDFNTDRDTYNLGESIKVRGLAKDEDGLSVSNASIQAYFKGLLSYNTKTDDNGIFSIDVPTPDYESTYELDVKAERYPYQSFFGSKNINVIKSKDILIDFPDTIKMSNGENVTQKLNIVNTGQSDISNMGFYLEGLQEGYFALPANTSLRTGEEKSFYVNFTIPFFAQNGLTSVTLRVEGNGLTQDKVFGLNIAKATENSTQTSPTTGYASGFAMPNINFTEAAYVVIFAAICFSMSILLKKIKITRSNRSKVRGYLFDSKNFLVGNSEVKKTSDDKYDKVILTEFPNFMKFTKKLKEDQNG